MSQFDFHHEGGCDCGAVRFVYHCRHALADLTARRCQCEFCLPRQAAYLGEAATELDIHLRDIRYLYAHRFGTGTADFMHCAVCNTEVYVCSDIDSQRYALVSARALDGYGELQQFVDTDFDGEQLTQRLQRRAERWIPSLCLQTSSDG